MLPCRYRDENSYKQAHPPFFVGDELKSIKSYLQIFFMLSQTQVHDFLVETSASPSFHDLRCSLLALSSEILSRFIKSCLREWTHLTCFHRDVSWNYRSYWIRRYTLVNGLMNILIKLRRLKLRKMKGSVGQKIPQLFKEDEYKLPIKFKHKICIKHLHCCWSWAHFRIRQPMKLSMWDRLHSPPSLSEWNKQK